jgi:hypothetical protein
MIKLPFYDEIKIEPKDLFSIEKIIEKSKIGKVPIYFDISHLNKKHQKEFLKDFFELAKNNDLNLYFPYPVYIVSNLEETGSVKTKLIFKKTDDLPCFYKKDLQKLRAKEVSILKKIFFNSERINNLENQPKLNFVVENAKNQKLLFELTKEFNFFKNVLDELDSKEV